MHSVVFVDIHTNVTALPPGTIWSRYSLVINPVNYNLFSVNVFVATTGFYQLFRIWRLEF